MLLNAILKIQHVFQEQLQEQQFHAQQEQLHAQMLKIKMFAQDWLLVLLAYVGGQLHVIFCSIKKKKI
jgi:hypothetical protein